MVPWWEVREQEKNLDPETRHRCMIIPIHFCAQGHNDYCNFWALKPLIMFYETLFTGQYRQDKSAAKMWLVYSFCEASTSLKWKGYILYFSWHSYCSSGHHRCPAVTVSLWHWQKRDSSTGYLTFIMRETSVWSHHRKKKNTSASSTFIRLSQ